MHNEALSEERKGWYWAMSSMQYITAKAHIATDSEGALELARRVAETFTNSRWDIDEQDGTVEEGEEFVEAEVKAYGFDIDEPLSVIDESLKEIESLENGSFGLLIVESDFGVDGFDCYGDIELAEVDSVGGDVTWASEDFLCLHISMEAAGWQEALGCDMDSLADEIESQGDDLLSSLLPDGFLQAYEKDEDAIFQYVEMNPFKFGGDTYQESEEVTVVFELDGHELKHETLEGMANALKCGSGESSAPNAKFLLTFNNASEDDGTYENKMVDADAYAMLVFKSSWNGIIDFKVLVPRGGKR